MPKKIIGEYLNVKDSSTLLVQSGQIIKTFVADFAGPKSELDSIDKATFKNDTSFTELESGMRIDVVVKGDSIFQHMDYKDTIFCMSQGDVLRKFKGYYFLNHQTSKNSWNVIKVSRTKRDLTLGTIWTKEDIQMLRELTETKNDSITTFRPTKKQLKKFLKGNGFSHEDTYVKVK